MQELVIQEVEYEVTPKICDFVVSSFRTALKQSLETDLLSVVEFLGKDHTSFVDVIFDNGMLTISSRFEEFDIYFPNWRVENISAIVYQVFGVGSLEEIGLSRNAEEEYLSLNITSPFLLARAVDLHGLSAEAWDGLRERLGVELIETIVYYVRYNQEKVYIHFRKFINYHQEIFADFGIEPSESLIMLLMYSLASDKGRYRLNSPNRYRDALLFILEPQAEVESIREIFGNSREDQRFNGRNVYPALRVSPAEAENYF